MTRCNVYRSSRAEFTYLFLREDLALEDIPASLLELLGEPEPVMEIDLAERGSLGKEDIDTVKQRMIDPGYHLQLPPEDDPSGWLDLPPKKL